MSDNIYENMTNEDLDTLDEIIGNKVRSGISIQNQYISNHRPWLAIFAKHLNEREKILLIKSYRYYFKQEHLDEHFPTNPERTRIAPPFDRSGASAEYEIQFIDTSTGAKIYEYASALCKANIGYIDRQSLAVSLTKDKSHKVKIIHLNNTVWILSNNIDDDFVEKSLALFPFLFAIEDLQKDPQIIGCCKAVAKGEPIKTFFQSYFENLAEVRQQKKIGIIRTALNARLRESIARTERDIKNTQDYIQEYEERLTQYHEKLEMYQAQKLGYESKEKVSDEDVADVLNFVERNRFIQSLGLIRSSNDYGTPTETLQLDILAPITIYETEPLERQINNRIDEYNRYEPKSKVLRAFKRIFIDEELQMICQTFVKLDIAHSNLDGSSNSNRKNSSDYNRMPQPHLSRYNCWGDNKYAIVEALRNSDLVGAMNNILIATQNINFTDSTVLSSWVETIANSSYLYNLPTCLSKVDGRLWSIKEIVEQLDREEKTTQPESEDEEIEQPELIDEVPF